MKTIKNIWVIAVVLLTLGLYSCKDENNDSSAPAKIDRVYLENAQSSVPDREVTFARLGQTIRLEGNGFSGLSKVLINGKKAPFNPVLVANKSMIVVVPVDAPTFDADEDVRNTIVIVKGGKQYTFDFDIRAAAPAITNVSHTMPLTGEEITLTGTGLQGVTQIIFPDNIEATTFTSDDEKGEWVKVVVPSGISENGGSIFVKCDNGGAYSPAYFNCKIGLILDFDGHGDPAGWTANAITSDDFLSDVIGHGNVSQGKYCPLVPSRLAPISSGPARATEVWTTGSEDWRSQYVPNLFHTDTPLEKIAFQFDMYVPEEWNNTGFIGVNLANNFSLGNQWTGEYYNYIPWLDGSKKVAFKTEGWITVTIPLNKFYKYSSRPYTFEDILIFRETSSNKNFGLFFDNNDFTLKDITGKDSDKGVEFLSSDTSVKVYVDNLRLVSLETPAYSDFPENE